LFGRNTAVNALWLKPQSLRIKPVETGSFEKLINRIIGSNLTELGFNLGSGVNDAIGVEEILL